MSTILDVREQRLQKGEEKLERWKQHLEKVLNVQRGSSECAGGP